MPRRSSSAVSRCVVLRMQVSSITALTVTSEWTNANSQALRTARSFIHSPTSLSPCIHQRLFLNRPRLSPATLRGIRQGAISRFLCVCPVLLDLHFHFPCDAAPFCSHSSQLSIQPSLSLSASHSCLTTIALLTRHRLPESWQNDTPTVNKRRVALLRLLSATSTSSDITLHFTSRLHSCTRHARA